MKSVDKLRPFALEVYFSKLESAARYQMSGSDMQSMTVAEVLNLGEEADRTAWEQLYLGYTETWGLPSLRDAIASTYDNVKASEILCFAGAEEGIYALMHALLEGGDHVITTIPNYQSVESIPLTICATTGIPLDPDQNWELDLDRMRDAIRPNTRLICINFPNNPTGKVISRAKLGSLIEIARSRGIYLLSDEVFRNVERKPEMTLPQVADLYERGLSLGVMSKCYGLPGLRIGWVACKDQELLHRMERVKHYTTICNSAPSELLAQIALKARRRILAQNRALIGKNLALLGAFFAAHRDLFEWYLPDGGCIGFPRYLGGEGVEKFVNDVMEKTGVLFLPASIYRSDLGPTPTDRFRIGYGRANMEEGLVVLGDYLNARRAV